MVYWIKRFKAWQEEVSRSSPCFELALILYSFSFLFHYITTTPASLWYISCCHVPLVCPAYLTVHQLTNSLAHTFTTSHIQWLSWVMILSLTLSSFQLHHAFLERHKFTSFICSICICSVKPWCFFSYTSALLVLHLNLSIIICISHYAFEILLHRVLGHGASISILIKLFPFNFNHIHLAGGITCVDTCTLRGVKVTPG